MARQSKIDWFIFSVGSAMILTIVATIVIAPTWSTAVIENAFAVLTREFGVYYLIAAALVFAFLLVIAVSDWGRVTLGPVGEGPRYSAFSWSAMLFCTGIGSTLIYWGATEWVFYYTDPPFGIKPRTDSAIAWASTYGLFHWGPVAWSLYCLPTLAFCCTYYLRRIPSLRLSTACIGIIGMQSERWPGRLIDLTFIVGLVGTSATGLGFGIALVTSSITLLTGMPDEFQMQLVTMVVITLLIATSVYRGLDKGIKVLSLINAVLALTLVAFVFLFGPTRFILETGFAALGNAAQNFLKMLTWTDPLERSDFVESWTVFFWAWWLALGPFVGVFVAKISQGRTVRQVIFGMLGWGSAGCFLFFIVLGNYALNLELQGVFDVVAHTTEVSPSSTIAEILRLLPLGSFWLIFLALLGTIFTATTYDSASYALAAVSTRHLGIEEHPARLHRVYWAFFLGLLPTVLLFLGGLRALQTASIVASLPVLLVYLLLAASIVNILRKAPVPGDSI